MGAFLKDYQLEFEYNTLKESKFTILISLLKQWLLVSEL